MFVYLKFKFTRALRRYRRESRSFRKWLGEYVNTNIWGRWRQLKFIRRFLGLWLGLWLVVGVGLLQQVHALNQYYLKSGPAAGGVYIEGLVGQVQQINPLLPQDSQADDISALVFNGLTRITPTRGIEGDLATSWSISPDGKSYTFHLRHDVKWQDGTAFTAQDVLFTLSLIQNPDTRSPLANSWQGVQAEAPDAYTVVYTLPNPYPPFIDSTTVGILPVHKLGSENPSQLPVSSFNQAPVGTGSFEVQSLNTVGGVVDLTANPSYFRGKPQLSSFQVRFYSTEDNVAAAYAKKQITAIGRLRGTDLADSTRLGQAHLYDLSLPDETDLFMRTTSANLGDVAVRKAITQALDRTQIMNKVAGGLVTALTLPILPGQLGYTSKYQVPGYDVAAANAALDADGWTRKGQARTKNGQTLQLKLATLNSGDYPGVAAEIKAELGKVGIEVTVVASDVTTLQQSYIRPRNYDLLLYAINIGADPDVYAYWHSSQASDPGLNLSQYNSKDADKALESARVALDPAVRIVRYGNFLQAWTSDLPAVVLYNPSYVYAVNPSVEGITARKLVNPADRFYDVQNWTVETKLIPKLQR